MVYKKYRRSISFPAPKPTTPAPELSAGRRAIIAKSSYRTRSASLPTRLHPLSAHINADLTALTDWTAASTATEFAPTSAGALADGLALLHILVASLPDLIQLPQALESLKRHANRRAAASASIAPSCSGAAPAPSFVDRLLDEFLRLADAHGCFRHAALELKSQLAETRAAIRRLGAEPSRLSSCLRAQRRAEREVARLGAAVLAVGRRLPVLAADADESEVAAVMRDVVTASAASSAAVFVGVAAASSAAVASVPSPRTWLEESLARWRWRAKAKTVMKKELQHKLTVESALKGWLDRARSGASKKPTEGLETGRKGLVENSLRRWLDRAKARSKREEKVVVDRKKKGGAVEAGLMRWLSRAKERSKNEELGKNGIGEGKRIGDNEILVDRKDWDENVVPIHCRGREDEGDEWRKAAMKGLTALEDRVAALESGSELVFRDLINVRVALLNILTPCF